MADRRWTIPFIEQIASPEPVRSHRSGRRLQSMLQAFGLIVLVAGATHLFHPGWWWKAVGALLIIGGGAAVFVRHQKALALFGLYLMVVGLAGTLLAGDESARVVGLMYFFFGAIPLYEYRRS